MSRNATQPGDRSSKRSRRFSWDTMIDDICRGNYALVIGSEVLLDRETTDGEMDATRYLLNLTLSRLENEGEISSASRFSSFNELSFKYSDAKDSYLDTIESLRENNGKLLNPALADILRGKWFRIVLTTEPNPILENFLRDEVWGDELRVMSIFSESANDYMNNESDGREFYPCPPTLYYIFGKADPNDDRNPFVFNDADTIKCISRWFGDRRPKNFIKFIQSKRLLALGCKLEDWCFRFFWHAMRQDSDITSGDIAVTIDKGKESDRNLIDYFSGHKVHIEENAQDFLSELKIHLSDESIKSKMRNNLGSIFISYANEDRAIAMGLYNKLIDAGFKVWLDIRLGAGDEYNKRISNAIKQCKVFIAILSNVAAHDLEVGKEDRWYRKEWKMAADMGRTVEIIFVQAFGYDCRNPYHQKVEALMGRGTSIFDWKASSLSELYRTIEKLLNKEQNG